MPKTIPSAFSGATKQGERNDCVVRAISNVSGKYYDEIHAVLKKHGRKDCRGTYWETSEKALRSLGYKAVYIGTSRAAKYYGMYRSQPYESKNKTLQTLVNDLPRGKFVVFIRGHATALIDGKIVDTFDNKASARVMAIYYHPDEVFAGSGVSFG